MNIECISSEHVVGEHVLGEHALGEHVLLNKNEKYIFILLNTHFSLAVLLWKWYLGLSRRRDKYSILETLSLFI